MTNADRRHRCSQLRENWTSARPEAGRTGGLHQPVPLSGPRPSQEREAAAGTDEKSREQSGTCLWGNQKKAEKARCRTLESVKAATASKIKPGLTNACPRRGAAPALQGPLSPRPRPPRNLRAALCAPDQKVRHSAPSSEVLSLPFREIILSACLVESKREGERTGDNSESAF